MVITFKGQHKSLNSFVSEPLNNFAIITGENGCGKSQLIELLKMKSESAIPTGLSITLNPDLTKIQIEGIENQNLSSLDNQSWKVRIDEFIRDYKNTPPYCKQFMAFMIEANTWTDELNAQNVFEIIHSGIITKEELKTLLDKMVSELKSGAAFYLMGELNLSDDYSKSLPFFKNKRKPAIAMMEVAKYRRKSCMELTDTDFYLTAYSEELLDMPLLFGSQIEYIFYNYARRRESNRRAYFDKIQDGDENDAIAEDEFVKKYEAPWDLVNKILTEHNVNFQFRGLDKKDYSPDAFISFELEKKSNGKIIKIQDLSSGEKIIIGLVIKLFTSSYYQDKLEFPNLIVLDEPDAHLHPAMSKLLIDVLHNTFVKQLGIHVIMVTHSPSTVALCPDDSIYELKNEPKTSLNQISKDDALKILTGHLPTLSIDYKNHKQVFVESPTDIEYYQTIFNKLNEERNYDYRLYFISNSAGKGNCDQVIKIVNDIRTSGNQTSYGIVDWDLNNTATDFVKVHGQGNRYNVENYLYDPIYIAILLMDNDAHNIYDELGLPKTTNHFSIGNESNEYLQKIADWFFGKYYEKYKVGEKQRADIKTIQYLNGKTISLPKWYLELSGHDFEKNIKSMFPVIERKYTSEGDLQKEISLIIGKSYPLIPMDSVNLIEELMTRK